MVLSNADKHFEPDVYEEAKKEFEKKFPRADINKRIIDELDRLKLMKLTELNSDY